MKTSSSAIPSCATAESPAPEFMPPKALAQHLGMSRAWLFEQLRLYRDTNGRKGIGPTYRPTGARKILLRRTDAIKYMAKFMA